MTYKNFLRKDLERIAHETRTAHGKFDGKRLLVDLLVDKLGFQLIPIEGLKSEFGIEAYIPKRKNTIIVDKTEMNYGSPRYYMTLAEEIAHCLIHVNFDGADANTLESWISKLSDADYRKLEADAKYLAAALLMPKDDFCAEFKKHWKKQEQNLKKGGLNPDRHTVIRYAVRRTFVAYGVSFEAVTYRARQLNLIKPHDLVLLRRYLSKP